MNFTKVQKLYVVLWDGWNFKNIFKHNEEATNYVKERMFSDMYEVKEILTNDLMGEQFARVLLKEHNEFCCVCPNDDIDYANKDERIIKVKLQ